MPGYYYTSTCHAPEQTNSLTYEELDKQPWEQMLFAHVPETRRFFFICLVAGRDSWGLHFFFLIPVIWDTKRPTPFTLNEPTTYICVEMCRVQTPLNWGGVQFIPWHIGLNNRLLPALLEYIWVKGVLLQTIFLISVYLERFHFIHTKRK